MVGRCEVRQTIDAANDLLRLDDLRGSRCRALRTPIVATGTLQRIEDMIAELVTCTIGPIGGLNPVVRTALVQR